MGADDEKLINVLKSSAHELQQGIELHCGLVKSILENKEDRECLQPLFDLCPKRSREVRLESALKEAIEVLEESRKAFKSKKLEILRKKLTQVLIDHN